MFYVYLSLYDDLRATLVSEISLIYSDEFFGGMIIRNLSCTVGSIC